MLPNAYSSKQVRAILQRILELVIGSIVFLLIMAGTVLLMAALAYWSRRFEALLSYPS